MPTFVLKPEVILRSLQTSTEARMVLPPNQRKRLWLRRGAVELGFKPRTSQEETAVSGPWPGCWGWQTLAPAHNNSF